MFQENGISNETFLKFEIALSPYKWTESFFCGKNLERKNKFFENVNRKHQLTSRFGDLRPSIPEKWLQNMLRNNVLTLT